MTMGEVWRPRLKSCLRSGPGRLQKTIGGRVAAVAGPAAEAGIQVGDVIMEVDGVRLRDVIDWMWLTDVQRFTVRLFRGGRELAVPVERSGPDPVGVSFEEPLFDGIRQCHNACVFCFIAQLPRGLRASLYVRDDDYRLSFLSGNFVTLTNVEDEDVRRILEQGLSPLYVSVHAADAILRRKLMRPAGEDRALDVLDELLEGGIQVHVQVVLVPGVNDGEVLDETLAYLASREGVRSVGCVPMGYTSHQKRFDSSYTSETASETLQVIGDWQDRMRAERGMGWVYGADELYLLSGVEMPGSDEYDGFPQFENGVGMVRSFVDEFCTALRGAKARGPQVTLVTGTLFAPVLNDVLERAGLSARVLAVDNVLFGGNVSVAGLLGGADIVRAVRADGARGTYLIPDVVVNSDGLLLDEISAASLGRLCAADVRVIPSDGASLAEAMAQVGRARV